MELNLLLWKWPNDEFLVEEGFIVASDERQEWLLPWWWDRYSKSNHRPVTFVDFGMTQESKEWCQKRGNVVDLSNLDLNVAQGREGFSSALIRKWEKRYGQDFWIHRNAWFKKPLACLLSPYKTTVWMDLDCEIKGALDPLFSQGIPFSGISAVSEYNQGKWLGVNSGVLVFQRGSIVIQQWAEESLHNHETYPGDQDALSAKILELGLPAGDLPSCYNSSRFNPESKNALIVHWHGDLGKEIIKNQIQNQTILAKG